MNDAFMAAQGKSHYFYWDYTRENPQNAFFYGAEPRYEAEANKFQFGLSSSGPDQTTNYQTCIESGLGSFAPCHITVNFLATLLGEGIYDPTNGTVSNGDVRRTGKGILKSSQE